jgi:hypothetical protein
MQGPNTLKRHAHLVDQMAATLGIDLEESALRGKLEVDEISDAVLACTGCANPGACEGWLDAHAEGSDTPPEYCRNADLFARLARS